MINMGQFFPNPNVLMSVIRLINSNSEKVSLFWVVSPFDTSQLTLYFLALVVLFPPEQLQVRRTNYRV